jgi:TonB family protein
MTDATHPSRRWRVWSIAILTMLLAASTAAAQDLAAARSLYAEAAYEDALTLLNRLRNSAAGPADRDESQVIDQYRAFCLLALGRASEAERIIEAIVAQQPLYHPSEAEASPRVRTAFSVVRQRMLPSIVQQKYAQGKNAFDRGEFAVAAATFDAVVNTFTDPDLVASASQPPLSDLRTLALGFRDLSVKAIPPPPPPPPLAPEPLPAPTVPRIYGMETAAILPPVTVRQVLPLFPSKDVPVGKGILEIIIDEAGTVESARIVQSINTAYDSLALTATKTWKYKPAMLNGVPVKFRKLVNITLRQTS